MSIVKAINGRDDNWEWGCQIIEDIRRMLSNRHHWLVSHKFREANKATDFLAKFALNMNEGLAWMEDGPEGLYSLILRTKL